MWVIYRNLRLPIFLSCIFSRLNIFNTVTILSQTCSQEEFGGACARDLLKMMVLLVRPLPKVLIGMIASGKFGSTNSSNSKNSMVIASWPESKTIGKDLTLFEFDGFGFRVLVLHSMLSHPMHLFQFALYGLNSLGIWVQKQRKFFRERQAGKTSNILTSEKVVSLLCEVPSVYKRWLFSNLDEKYDTNRT